LHAWFIKYICLFALSYSMRTAQLYYFDGLWNICTSGNRMEKCFDHKYNTTMPSHIHQVRDFLKIIRLHLHTAPSINFLKKCATYVPIMWDQRSTSMICIGYLKKFGKSIYINDCYIMHRHYWRIFAYIVSLTYYRIQSQFRPILMISFTM
jgi:hypothetical protein